MNICPITYHPCGDELYSAQGLKMLSRKLTHLNSIPFTQEEQVHQAAMRADKMSIQGVQPKLSARLNIRKESFEIVDNGGEYILKPENYLYPELPANESLTMKLAEITGIEVPLNGMVYSSDGRLTYFIKRFDREGKKKKISVEDFSQLAGKSRDTKYDYSMEKLILLIDTYCTFPAIEKVKLFRLTLFNFLTGNEDMHLKNYSIITRNEKIELSPAYDLVNTTIALKNAKEEIALPIDGKKNHLNEKDFVEYFAKKKLRINDSVISREITKMQNAKTHWEAIIIKSFLSKTMKQRYTEIIAERSMRIGI